MVWFAQFQSFIDILAIVFSFIFKEQVKPYRLITAISSDHPLRKNYETLCMIVMTRTNLHFFAYPGRYSLAS